MIQRRGLRRRVTKRKRMEVRKRRADEPEKRGEEEGQVEVKKPIKGDR